MPLPRVVLVHGGATTASVWSRMASLLEGVDVVAVDRPCSGDLATELATLAPHAEGALVVGVSGGATLGLALAASDVRLAGAILHEPAVGRLVPGLLAPMAAAYEAGGVDLFAATLYGTSWNRTMAPADDAMVARDLAMFRAFEPAAAREGQGPVLITVGADSPPARHAAARALHDTLGYRTQNLPGCRHFVQWDNPEVLADLVMRALSEIAATRD
ncbi:MAG: alpha/beta fold hydrolase [Microbacteriaceae bacterium]